MPYSPDLQRISGTRLTFESSNVEAGFPVPGTLFTTSGLHDSSALCVIESVDG